MKTMVRAALSLTLAFGVFQPAVGQEFDKVEIGTIQVSDTVYMMTGAGGNLAVCVGDDMAFLVDDQFAPLTEKIVAAIAKISDKPIEFVLNTHWHGDHTGGNENLAEQGSVIVAHENVRKRMSASHINEIFGTRTEPAPAGALPQLTFTESVTFHTNGEEIFISYTGAAHTDTDSIVYFKNSNVIHTGDIYFNGMFPFIDVSSGGSVDGVIAVVKDILANCDEDTVIIPGHGPKSSAPELREYLAMLEHARSVTLAEIEKGTEKPMFIYEKPFADLEEKWGGGFLPADVFADILYQSLAGPIETENK